MAVDRTLASPRRRRRRPPADVPKIKSVRVEELFGKYTFEPFSIYGLDSSHPNIAFLYGENGVGKTTILKLIYALLSPEPNSGLRGFLARTRFHYFGVEFDDGQIVAAKRAKGSNVGTFDYIFHGPRLNKSFNLVVTQGRVMNSDNPGFVEIIQGLQLITPTIVLVNDARTVRSTYEPWDVRSFLNEQFLGRRRQIHYDADMNVIEADVDTIASTGLSQLLQQAHGHLRDRAIDGNAVANAGIGQIYSSVVKTIAKASSAAAKPSENNYSALLQRIAEVDEYFVKYSGYGLSQADHLADIRRNMSTAKPRAREQLYELIEPYVSSLEKRIEANRTLAEQIYAFEKGVNGFLKRKQIICKIDRPIHFVDEEDVRINAENLSSGERHLIYLCCVSMLSRDRQALVIVDEPELSLNYKWQNRLVSSLLAISGKTTQFLMATHSFEIISDYRLAAITLEPTVAAA